MKTDKRCLCGAPMELHISNSEVELWKCLFCSRVLVHTLKTGLYWWYTLENWEIRSPLVAKPVDKTDQI